MKLFLCGDVMTGRGIDQVLPHPCAPAIYEHVLTSAYSYVELAERTNGPIARPVPHEYVWGDVIDELRTRAQDLRIVNLETSVTTRAEPYPKGINYRMNPANIPCLRAAGIDCCVLANNHVMDWGREGFRETLASLSAAGIATAGAGLSQEDAAAPAILATPADQRLLVFGLGSSTSGIPRAWAAARGRPGVNLLSDLSSKTARRVASGICRWREGGDIVMVSIHWGDNWGYGIPDAQRGFAHQLIDAGAADIIHGHSSHHAKGIEVYDRRLILYGCGDFINDYEGIGGYEAYRPDLAVAYFPEVDELSGYLTSLELAVFQHRRFSLKRATPEDQAWVQRALGRECERLGSTLEASPTGSLRLRW
jgi:poly-gamma-glutamate synthesis protein (capsule biosynthesis protein)